jgi:hypothetical protein
MNFGFHEPTAAQLEYVNSIAHTLQIEIPEPLTFEAASEFIDEWHDELPNELSDDDFLDWDERYGR